MDVSELKEDLESPSIDHPTGGRDFLIVFKVVADNCYHSSQGSRHCKDKDAVLGHGLLSSLSEQVYYYIINIENVYQINDNRDPMKLIPKLASREWRPLAVG
ncbi:uncharacterized protein CIMG_13087 [Coccidioides immitis RS]|uniref:Uncharacterized protein n=1 Tax=Coccidioides immitis (strain RS) TaxID=246410 RepID=A0A0D8JTI5_COCIM|nr:uncharacterized protein CIMG_13087 [Coccidioides immitis RS]KJF60635.1 hypothetical protein CIMG_13087 [Coccidioides immitis RS]